MRSIDIYMLGARWPQLKTNSYTLRFPFPFSNEFYLYHGLRIDVIPICVCINNLMNSSQLDLNLLVCNLIFNYNLINILVFNHKPNKYSLNVQLKLFQCHQFTFTIM